MSQKTCTCPPFEGRNFYELITFFGLLEEKSKSKNCCEDGGFICPQLDRALRKAYAKQYSEKASGKTRGVHTKSLTKKQLIL